MGIVKQMPTGTPTTNALADIPDESGERELRLGQNVLLALENYPEIGETRDIVLRLRCNRHIKEQLAVDGDITHACGMKIITAWEHGQPKPPNAEDNQPGLYDDAGQPNPDAEPGDDEASED